MNSIFHVLIYTVLLYLHKAVLAVELTFELPDNARECFYQEIEKNKSAILEFQVLTLYQLLRLRIVYCIKKPRNTNKAIQNSQAFFYHFRWLPEGSMMLT